MALFNQRCFTCQKVISIYYEKYTKFIKDDPEFNKSIDKFLDDNDILRICCRRFFYTYPMKIQWRYLELSQPKNIITTPNLDMNLYVTKPTFTI